MRLVVCPRTHQKKVRKMVPLAPFCPAVCRVVVVHVAQKQARVRPVDDETDVAADPDRPEVLVLRLVKLVKLHPRIRRIHLEVECRRLDGLLFVASEATERVSEGVGDTEVQNVDARVE